MKYTKGALIFCTLLAVKPDHLQNICPAQSPSSSTSTSSYLPSCPRKLLWIQTSEGQLLHSNNVTTKVDHTWRAGTVNTLLDSVSSSMHVESGDSFISMLSKYHWDWASGTLDMVESSGNICGSDKKGVGRQRKGGKEQDDSELGKKRKSPYFMDLCIDNASCSSFYQKKCFLHQSSIWLNIWRIFFFLHDSQLSALNCAFSDFDNANLQPDFS